MDLVSVALQPVPPPNTPKYVPAAAADADVEAEEKRRREGDTAFALYESVEDDTKKLVFLRRAGERGNVHALDNLRRRKTEDEECDWFQKAVDAGHPFANYDLWIALLNRDDVTQADRANQLPIVTLLHTKRQLGA